MITWWQQALALLVITRFVSPHVYIPVLLAGLASLSIKRFLSYRQYIKQSNNLPGFRVFITPFSLPSFFIPSIHFSENWLFNFRPNLIFDPERSIRLKKKFGCSIISTISVWPPRILLGVADAEAVQYIVSKSKLFIKPTEAYTILSSFGPNLLVLEGDAWKRHRRIAGPAFSEANNLLVWQETDSVLKKWFADLNHQQDANHVTLEEHVTDLLMKVTLSVISVAGFGKQIPWGKEEGIIPAGHTLSFKAALQTVLENLFLVLLTPSFVLRLPITQKLRTTSLANDELNRYFEEMIAERQATSHTNNDRADVFSMLLREDLEKRNIEPLNLQELKGNIYILLVAGHETTAHTLSFALALLALYPEEQEHIRQELRTVVGETEEIRYEHFSKLTYCMAVLYEVLRLFPPVAYIPKLATEDTVLPASKWHKDGTSERTNITIPKGCYLDLDTTGLHRNPEYWGEDSLEFRPSRFIDTETYRWPRDAFIPWSAGARNCIGMKFAQVESICVLANVVKNYSIELASTEATFAETKAKLLECSSTLTLTPLNVKLKFRKR